MEWAKINSGEVIGIYLKSPIVKVCWNNAVRRHFGSRVKGTGLIKAAAGHDRGHMQRGTWTSYSHKKWCLSNARNHHTAGNARSVQADDTEPFFFGTDSSYDDTGCSIGDTDSAISESESI